MAKRRKKKKLTVFHANNRMRDSSGPIPEPKNALDALHEIRKVALDKRAHVTWDDTCEWLQMKMRTIALLAYRGMKAGGKNDGKD